jgi:hypothetical protein
MMEKYQNNNKLPTIKEYFDYLNKYIDSLSNEELLKLLDEQDIKYDIVKAKINNGVIECMSQICNETSCPNYNKCKIYKIEIKEIQEEQNVNNI